LKGSRSPGLLGRVSGVVSHCRMIMVKEGDRGNIALSVKNTEIENALQYIIKRTSHRLSDEVLVSTVYLLSRKPTGWSSLK
jgi:hypothetical protein